MKQPEAILHNLTTGSQTELNEILSFPRSTQTHKIILKDVSLQTVKAKDPFKLFLRNKFLLPNLISGVLIGAGT